MATAKEWRDALKAVLEETRKCWSKHHKSDIEALRWWRAHGVAKEMVESYGLRDWTEMVLNGMQGTPRTWEELVEELAKEGEEEGAVEEYAGKLRSFYKEE